MNARPAADAETVQAACAHCGQVNRVPATRLADDPTCGRCKNKVFPHQPLAVTAATWAAQVERSPLPVLADFWAPWCGPCHAVAPALEQIAARRASRLKVVKVNVDENQELAGRFGVRSIPTMVVLRGGREVDRMVGALPAAEIERRLARRGDG
ncbi:MAG TPA: thioredoxin TrxC [Kofleriaceae bacterium]|nr:thioredoxin TrxC [Kofleriaceae bacterium]